MVLRDELMVAGRTLMDARQPIAPLEGSLAQPAPSSLAQRKQPRACADEEIALRDRDAGAVACAVAFDFEIRGVAERELATVGLHHGYFGVETQHLEFAVAGGGCDGPELCFWPGVGARLVRVRRGRCARGALLRNSVGAVALTKN